MSRLSKLLSTAMLTAAAFACAGGTAAAAAPCANADLPVSQLAPGATEVAVQCLVNGARTDAGRTALMPNSALAGEARTLATAGSVTTGNGPYWAKEFGGATPAPTPRDAVNAWMADPSYGPMMLDPKMTDFGVGYAQLIIPIGLIPRYRSVFQIKLRLPLSVITQPAGCSGADVPITAATLAAAEQAIVCLTNEERVKANLTLPPDQRLAPLTVHSVLTGTARAHSRDMVARRYFDHISPEGRTECQRIVDAGYPARCVVYTDTNGQFPQYNGKLVCLTGRCGENIAFDTGSATPRHFVTGWMNSTGHREAILRKSFDHIGVGLAAGTHQGASGFMATQNFGSPD